MFGIAFLYNGVEDFDSLLEVLQVLKHPDSLQSEFNGWHLHIVYLVMKIRENTVWV